MLNKQPSKAWVVAVDMGYGHERAAYALRDLAYNQVIIANNYPGIPRAEQAGWKKLKQIYEKISQLKSVPIIGNTVFEAMDFFQQIEPFYPRRNLSTPSLQLRQTYFSIQHQGTGKHLVEHAKRQPLPFVATFFQAAYAAEEFGYPGDIYCVVCDADCSRAWAPLKPDSSRIKYLVPNGRVVERLKLYGVKPQNIYLTGFPLPKELIGGAGAPILKRDLARRLKNLDPRGIFRRKYRRTLAAELGSAWERLNHAHPLTLTFAVGGAGAQVKLGVQIATSLREQLINNKLHLNLVTGVNHQATTYYRQALQDLKLTKALGRSVNIIHSQSRTDYFRSFSESLHTTDLLWTKPSELSFYTGLGLPIIIAPPIGSQEEFNQRWLMSVNGGIPQDDPRYTNEWLLDWVESGGLARLAWNGYIEAPTHGTYRIESLITGKKFVIEDLPLIV